MKNVVGYVVLLSLPVFGAESALDIVKRSLDLENRNFERQKDYTYQSYEVSRETDGSGKVTSTKSRKFDVLSVYGRPYTRLIEKDGKPLSSSENGKQEERLRKEMEKRQRQAEDPNSKERRAYEKSRADERKFLNEMTSAYDFRIAGEDKISGKPVWVIMAEPRPNFQPRESRAGLFKKIRGKLWIDKAEYQWAKLEAETTDTISFGWFLARLAKGGLIRFEQQRVNDEVWLPSHAEIAIEGRLGLVKKVRAGVELSYTNYRKFQTDSKVVSTEAIR